MEALLHQHGINVDAFLQLGGIGGHSRYHLEGNALIHSFRVHAHALEEFPDDLVMQKAALLHDVGKIFTSIEVKPGDWIYPDHSTCGSFRGILCKFIPLDDPHFEDYQWLIRNHIKPLFWKEKGISIEEINPSKPRLNEGVCTLNNLRTLAICDLLGSTPLDPSASQELINYLRGLDL